ncbi:hypothetical protein [Leuconostoc mesenteroides]|uniref:hypothetical protein n=1 Tax=Leuconostoc mesenteroides TaxID=1245 RepID=UPI000750FC8B|nr:hypothetical protein [Leuconostoc mesenteroides]MBZ1515373.1 hypothetical protein [Leuconostoc mesenteroides]
MTKHVYRKIDLSKHSFEIKGTPLGSNRLSNTEIHIYIDGVEIRCVKGAELIGDVDNKKTTLQLRLREEEALNNKTFFEEAEPIKSVGGYVPSKINPNLSQHLKTLEKDYSSNLLHILERNELKRKADQLRRKYY